MAVYINGIGNISPQLTFGDVPFLNVLTEYTNNKLTCIEPDYTEWIDARAIRRMSKIIRIGVASAKLALKEAGLEIPEAIITGTSFGCLDDTGIFLNKIIENKEEALNPTPFIQSTHNTIGSQVALLVQCLGYNQTYSHRAFSFENALLDAMMLVNETNTNVLVGGVDEVTNTSYEILKRFELFKHEDVLNTKLFEHKTKGTIQGEGAAYFLLAREKGLNAYAIVKDIITVYKPDHVTEVYSTINDMLARNLLSIADVDLLLLGKNGDHNQDSNYDHVASIFPGASVAVFKHLVGEHPTSNAFAVWLAARMLKEGKVPAAVFHSGKSNHIPKRILIYNQYLGRHHSLIILESC